jgi:hypothetical protein
MASGSRLQMTPVAAPRTSSDRRVSRERRTPIAIDPQDLVLAPNALAKAALQVARYAFDTGASGAKRSKP